MSIRELLQPAQRLLEMLHDGVVAVDEHGVVVYVNEANTRITGLTPADVVGRHVRDVVPDSALLETLATGREQVGVRTRVGDREVVSNVVPVHEDGRLIGVISVFRDITEVLHLNRELQEARNTIDMLRASMQEGAGVMDGIVIGRSPLSQRVFQTALKAAEVDSPVLIEGESGTGKEVIARLIHSRSPRKDRPLIAVNCAAIPGPLQESELFGYAEGAFTGARKGGSRGLFELADGGTLFLDEIGDMEPGLQAKLLRALQSGEIRPVGAQEARRVDVRIISATNRQLHQLVREKQFREDLYYRLRVIRLELPPLRLRREDLTLFLDHAVSKVCDRLGRAPVTFTPAALRILLAYPFPGNVRELENLVEQAVVMDEDGVIDVGDLPPEVTLSETAKGLDLRISGRFPTLEEMEKALLEAGVRHFDNKTDLAEHLGISRSTLYRKLERYGLL